MEVKAKVEILGVNKKISATNTEYFIISFNEILPHKDEKGNRMVRKFNDVYLPSIKDENALKECVSKEVEVTANFYPITRKVGDREFTDIKVTLLDVNNINEREIGTTEE